MKAFSLFITLIVLTGILVTFGFVHESSMPGMISGILGLEEISWYQYLNITGSSGVGGILLHASIWTILGLVGIVTKNEYMIWGALVASIGVMFQRIWWGILIASDNFSVIAPFNYLMYGIITFVYCWAMIEWIRRQM